VDLTQLINEIIVASKGNTVVEHSAHHPRVEGSTLATAALYVTNDLTYFDEKSSVIWTVRHFSFKFRQLQCEARSREGCIMYQTEPSNVPSRLLS
jgi:hypothetical protein